MDKALEPLDRFIADNPHIDAEREAAFALSAIDWQDPATLRWAAAMLALHAEALLLSGS